MVDERRTSPELDMVARRFAESTEALANVREQLQALDALRAGEETAILRLQDAAERIGEFTQASARAAQTLEEAQLKAADVLQTGATLLDGTALQGIVESVAANSAAIQGIQAQVTQLSDAMGVFRDAYAHGIQGIQAQLTQQSDAMGVFRDAYARDIQDIRTLVGEVAAAVADVNANLSDGLHGVSEKINQAHADLKTPIIVKRFF